jgi:hypothetical protein
MTNRVPIPPCCGQSLEGVKNGTGVFTSQRLNPGFESVVECQEQPGQNLR